MIRTRQQINAKDQVRHRCVDAGIQRALTEPSKDELRATLEEAARNTAEAADHQRLAEIDEQLRRAGYWAARLTALNEERQQIVERLAYAQRENRG